MFGFESERSPPPRVVEDLRHINARGTLRFLDALFVYRDRDGTLGHAPGGLDVDVSSDPPGSTLWQLLNGDSAETGQPSPLELQSSCEIGLDLAAVESLAYRIEAGTSALLVLVEARWATDLLDAVIAAGGLPIVSGCLEPETMLVVGPQVAAAAEAGGLTEAAATGRAIAALDLLATSPAPAAIVVATALRALVRAGVIDPADVDDTISAFAASGLFSLPAE